MVLGRGGRGGSVDEETPCREDQQVRANIHRPRSMGKSSTQLRWLPPWHLAFSSNEVDRAHIGYCASWHADFTICRRVTLESRSPFASRKPILDPSLNASRSQCKFKLASSRPSNFNHWTVPRRRKQGYVISKSVERRCECSLNIL